MSKYDIKDAIKNSFKVVFLYVVKIAMEDYVIRFNSGIIFYYAIIHCLYSFMFYLDVYFPLIYSSFPRVLQDNCMSKSWCAPGYKTKQLD